MMDKSWMGKPRNTDEYMSGIADFMKFAIGNMGLETKFRCPCKICCNQKSLYPNEVASHLLYKGIIQSYNIWTLHGEKRSNLNQDDISSSNNISPVGDDMHSMLHEAFQIPIMTEEEIMEEHVQKNTMNITAERFYKLLTDVEKELYPGCKKYNKLSFIVRLFNIKSKYGWSDVSFNELLDFLRDILPEGHQVPETFYQTKKVIKDLGLDYDKIDACENHCMLFWQEIGTDGLELCTKCGSKSIAKRQHDYEKKMGEKMSLLQTFKMMYTKKNGDPVNSVVAEKFVEIENMMACRSRNETEGENSNEGEILTQVLGKVDTTKPMCYGSFLTSEDIYGPRTKYRWSEHQESEKVDQMEKEFVSMKSKMLEMEENYKEKMHEMEKLYKHLQEQLHYVLNAKGQHAANGGKDSGNNVFPSTNEHSSAGSHVLLSHERDADEAGGRPLHGGEQEDGAGLPRPSVVGVRLRLHPHGLQTKKKVKKKSAPRTNSCAGQKNVPNYKTVLPDAMAPQQNHSNDAQAICLLGFNFERVAEGKIISKDPKKQLGAQPLGDEYYEVQVTKVLKPNMRLPTDWNKMLGQCEGDCIPWMKSFVLEDKCEESLT